MPVLSIPNLSPIGWEPGVDVGVPGGIPAKIAARTVQFDVVADWGADPTGAVAVQGVVNANIGSVSAERAIYWPYGEFLVTGAIPAKKNVTHRGAGDGKFSGSSVSIGTGTKVFEVDPGLGWTAGIRTRVWHAQDRYKWMRGTVVSYVGTTLTIDVDETSGHTGTYSLWTVGQTVFRRVGSVNLFTISSSSASAGLTAVTGDPVAGATTITVADGSLLWVKPAMCKISILPEDESEAYDHGAYLRESHSIRNWITDVTGNTVTLAHPLIRDLPSARSPRLTFAEINAYGVGFENFAAFGDGSSQQVFIYLGGMYSSWLYHVALGIENSYNINTQEALRCEIAWSYIGGTNGGAASASAITSGGANCCLIRESIIDQSIVTEGAPDINNAYLRNYGQNARWAINHGAGSEYNLWEYCIVPGLHGDSYHGFHRKFTKFRNHITGLDASLPYGFIIQNRYNRRDNNVGNVQGIAGSRPGLHSMGNPNMGNSANSGESIDPALFVSSGGVSGAEHRHFDVSGRSKLAGSITAKTGTKITITLTSHTLTDLSHPFLSGGDNFIHVLWGSQTDSDLLNIRRNMQIIRAESSGANIVMDDDPGLTSGGTLPAVGTSVWIHTAAFGTQEFDLAVESTSFNRKNYKVAHGGAGGPGNNGVTSGIEDDTADTLPDSLAETGVPEDWPASMTYPPDIDPDSPTFNLEATPAGFRFHNGYWPESAATQVAMPYFTPGAGSYSEAQDVVITCITAGATIRYTTDGSEPSPVSGTIIASGASVNVAADTVLKAIAYDGVLADSEVRTASYSILPVPAAPTSLTATAVSSSQINLAWSDQSSNETGFKIYRGTASGALSLIATVATPGLQAYSATGLAANTAYFFEVRAYNPSGDSEPSDEATATTSPAAVAPNAPTGLTATAVSNSQINLSWTDALSDETGFRVYRGTVSGVLTLVATLAAGVSSYQSTGLTTATQYFFKVASYNLAGTSLSSQVSATTLSNPPPIKLKGGKHPKNSRVVESSYRSLFL
jgi:hypothetical protein